MQRTSVVAAVLAVLASYGVVGPVSSAYAASLTGSAFEIDANANLTVQGGATALDWLDGSAVRADVQVKTDTPSGTSDNSFKSTHEDSLVPEVDAGSIPNNKSDLKQFGVYVEKTATQTFLNVFWSRVQDPSGSTDMDFEFNQSDVMHNDPVGSDQIIPVRTVGDLLMTYELTNGGTVATIHKRFWTGSQWGPETVLSSADAIGSINTSAITAADSGDLGPFSARTFGEASVDLAALIPASDGCRTYGSAYLKSRSSPSFPSEMKDFIAPEAVTISNCGAVRVHKTDANGPLAGATFTLYKDVAPVGGSKGAGDTVSAGSCTTAASGDCTISDVKKGEYWLVETTVPAGHDGVADRHVSITAGDQVVAFELDDPIQTGTITVTKNAVPNDGQDFTFALGATAFSLDDDADATLPATRSFTVPVGSHTLSETDVPTGWVLTGLSCTDPSGGTTVALPTATISLAKDETVACTFTNTFTKLDVNLQTQAAAAEGGGWNDGATLTGDGVHPVTGSVAFFACDTTSTATPCTAGGTQVGSAATVTHGTGATYTAATTTTYTPADAGWTCFRAEFTSTSDFYADSSHTNATSECFLKQAQDLTVSKTATAAFGRVYSWTIDKGVNDDSVSVPEGTKATSHYTVSVGNTHTDGTWSVSGDITVTNPNPVPFSGVTVTDAIDNKTGDCVVTAGTDATVPANDTLVLPYLCTYDSTPDPSDGTNTATATWDAGDYFTPDGSASGTATVDFANVTPSVTDEQVTVTDSVQGELGTVNALTDPNPKVFEYDVERSGVAGTCTPYENTATYTANDSETSDSDSQSVQVCVGSGLTLEATAAGSFDRSYLWTIDKAVDQTTVTVDTGDSATFNYTVTATADGSADSGYELAGTVSVTNPNDWEDVVADVTVTTDLGGGAVCTVTDGENRSVSHDAPLVLSYSCAFGTAPASTGTVTATATWDDAAASTPVASADLGVPVELLLDTETNATVTVVDDKTDPANPVTLGTATWGEDPTVFTYAVTKTADTADCTTYTNVATIVETEQSATADAELCGFTGGGGTIVTPPTGGGGGLAFTGDLTGLFARWALGMLLAGAVLLLIGRRRQA